MVERQVTGAGLDTRLHKALPVGLGSCGDGSFIFRELGSKHTFWVLDGAGRRGMPKDNMTAGENYHLSVREQRTKNTW